MCAARAMLARRARSASCLWLPGDKGTMKHVRSWFKSEAIWMLFWALVLPAIGAFIYLVVWLSR